MRRHPPAVPVFSSATMTRMKLLPLLLLLTLITTTTEAQEPPAGQSYEFLMAKLAVDDGRYDEALTLIDRVIEKAPGDPVLLFERAMILIDAGRVERAESELRRLAEASPDFIDARRILGRVLLERAGADRSRMEE